MAIGDSRTKNAALWTALAVFGALAALACGNAAPPIDPDAANRRAAASAMSEGNEAFAREEFRDAMDAYDRAAESLPEDPRPVYNSANALYMQNRLFEAIDKYEDALALAEPNLAADIYASMCRAILDSGDPEGAISSCESALEIDPDDYIAKRALEEASQADDPPEEEEAAQQPSQQGDQAPQPGGDQGGRQQQPQPSGDQQPPPNQQPGGDQQQQPNQQPGDQQQQDGEGDQERQGEGGQAGEPSGESGSQSGGEQAMVPPTGLTEDQARQLLDSAGDQTNALPRRSWDDAPSSNPGRDW